LSRLSKHGTSSPRYKLDGEVARGGMGAILKIWDDNLRRHLAMKVALARSDAPNTGGASQSDPRTLTRFLEEAQVTGQLDHPGIVPVHELGLDADGRVYFTMKLVEGRDLQAIFQLAFQGKEGWNETRALGVILKACEAVAYAHEKGVIHRDLKPANVMVGSFGEVYVMDWGLARVLRRADPHDIRLAPELRAQVSSSLTAIQTDRSDVLKKVPDSPLQTMDGDVLGTPAYMPPEQARGEIESLSARSDVYSIGAMLYHLLARQTPYERRGKPRNALEVLLAVHQGAPTPLHELRRDVPPELEAICDKAMARDPAQRYADTQELAEDLRAFLEGRVVKAYQTGAIVELHKWVLRNKPLAAALAAAALALIAGILVSTAKTREAVAARLETAAKNEELVTATKLAQEQEQLATRKTNDVLSLSAIQELKDLETRADALWPPDPENVPAYEAWLAEARVLIEGQPADPEHGVKKRPSLQEHEAKLAEIRGRARPKTPEEIEADQRSSPGYAEWEQAHAQLTWMRRMLGEEPWPDAAEVDASVAKETLPTDAAALHELALPIVYGSEVRGLVLAERALAAAKPSESAMIRCTLSWALFRCGLFEPALDEAQTAVDEAQGEEKAELVRSLQLLREWIARWEGPNAHAQQSDAAAKLAVRVAELGVALELPTYEFVGAEDRWWHEQLSKLVAGLKAFRDEETGLYSSGTSEEHGWGISKRADYARTIRERSLDGPRARERWDAAIAAIATSSEYGGLKLAPQLGLLPIGPDPASGLWEFSHLATAEDYEPAERGDDGKIVLTEETGIVLVLVPGGTFEMGTQTADLAAANYDPQALELESPVHEVTLSPYFLSKYEMTQGQWLRIAGRNPSQYAPANYNTWWSRAGSRGNLLHPVERVSWTECTDLLSRFGLALPSEAQWENAARGGTDTPYWTGTDLGSLEGAANIADAYGKAHGGESLRDWEQDFDDGATVHAEPGSYRANPYGLHDVIGNVWEWCLDGFDEHFYGRSPSVDPVAPPAAATIRVFRGGSFFFDASSARSGQRYNATHEFVSHDLGVRPARSVER
jgi:formylglycine-generating enzyme required for sulfatase activity/serine/threonine protein kinase